MPGGENRIKIDIIIILKELSTIIKNPLEKEINEIIIILIWGTNTVADVVNKSKIGTPRDIYIILKLERSILEKNEI